MSENESSGGSRTGKARDPVSGFPAEAEIVTARLSLRRCTRADVDAVFAYRRRSDVGRYLREGAWSRSRTEREINVCASALFAAPGDELVLLAQTQDGAVVIGEVGLVWRGTDTAEIGYVFDPESGGRGLATEAVSAVVDLAFREFGFLRLTARTDADNTASVRLCRRLGMRLSATARSTDGRHALEHTYELVRGGG